MKEDRKEKIVEEIGKDIKEKNTMSKEYEGKINKRIFSNIIIAVVILIYLILIIMGSKNIQNSIFIVDLKVFSIILSLVSIIIFEKSYKSADGRLCIYGIETLTLAIMTLIGVYVFQIIGELFTPIICGAVIAYAVYYLVKSIGIYNKGKQDYIKSQSDINEIVKDELPETAETKRRRNVLESQMDEYEKLKEINLKELDKEQMHTRKIKTQTRKIEEEEIENVVEEKIKNKNEKDEEKVKKTTTKKTTTKRADSSKPTTKAKSSATENKKTSKAKTTEKKDTAKKEEKVVKSKTANKVATKKPKKEEKPDETKKTTTKKATSKKATSKKTTTSKKTGETNK